MTAACAPWTAPPGEAFGRDLLNLTLASPSVNRHQKIAKDVAEWLPALNQCWYVNQVVLVKRKYNLTMNQAEASKAQQVLATCPRPIVMQFTDQGAAPEPPPPPCPSTCSQAHDMGMSNMRERSTRVLRRQFDRTGWYHLRRAVARTGLAPVPRGHPAYQYMRDGDSDGVVCE